jgi:L-lactate utilization protein LutB
MSSSDNQYCQEIDKTLAALNSAVLKLNTAHSALKAATAEIEGGVCGKSIAALTKLLRETSTDYEEKEALVYAAQIAHNAAQIAHNAAQVSYNAAIEALHAI